jgi:type I restriction enzyme R subunit
VALYYTSTSLKEETDINVLHELKSTLDDIGIYEQSEVEEFFEKYFSGVQASELSIIIDIAAQRFNQELELEDEEKADCKIKAKQFVKIYGQMASIMPYEIIAWEKLFWFLKFLIPKMIIKDKDQDKLDELLDAVDLSTYGLERVKLNAKIGLDENGTEVEPQNPNPRGAHGGNSEKDPLDEIIKHFNEKWFHGWEATPEEQKAKFIHIMDKVKTHDDYESKYENNYDEFTRKLALEKMISEVMNKERRKELELYKLFAGDEAFRVGLVENLERALSFSAQNQFKKSSNLF